MCPETPLKKTDFLSPSRNRLSSSILGRGGALCPLPLLSAGTLV